MPRASSILSVTAVLAMAGAAPAIELPVIVNGTETVQAPKSAPTTSPSTSKGQAPVIINYPSALLQTAPADQKGDGKAPVIVNTPAAFPGKAAPMRYPVAYNVPAYADCVGPVAYNAYGIGSMIAANGGYGYGMGGYFGGGLGYYGGYEAYSGFGSYGGYDYAPYYSAPWGFSIRPPLVETLDTGIRANVGHLVSMPSGRAPVFGSVLGVYYR